MTGERAVMLGQKVTYFGEFGYLNSSCIGKNIILMVLSSSRDKFTLWYQDSVTDVSVGARRLHTNLYKFGENVSLHISNRKNCCDLNLSEIVCIFIFFLFSDSGLYLLNGFDFGFYLFRNGVPLKTNNAIPVNVV